MTERMNPPFPRAVRRRAVHLMLEHQEEHLTQWAAMCSVVGKIGCSGETWPNRGRQAERDRDMRAGPTSTEGERMNALERKHRERRQANEILRKAAPRSSDR